MTSDVAHTHATALVTQMVDALQLGPTTETSGGADPCDGSNGLDLPHREADGAIDVHAFYTASVRTTAADIPATLDRIRGYWRQRGFRLGANQAPSPGEQQEWWIDAKEPGTNFDLSVVAVTANASISIEATSPCAYPVGTDDPRNPTWPPYTGPLS